METFETSVETEPSALATVRTDLDAWLQLRGLAEPRRGYVILATHEALANAIQHARSPGPIVLRAEARNGEFVIEVTDNGSWKLASTDRQDGRGLGLEIMRQLVSSATVTSGAAGTTVRLHQHC